ncbi:MAG: hypothetical protein IJ252_05910 [Solobacterium sp.]|nr:hypothetical protein [Solobacterium sp.]
MNRKETIKSIVSAMINDLRECEDGTETTTYELVSRYRKYGIEDKDLFEVDRLLFKEAGKSRIFLDNSRYDDLAVGLPYNIPFIVDNKHAAIKCPYCGSLSTARYIYGNPSDPEGLRKKIKAGKVVLSDCDIEPVYVNDNPVLAEPRRFCNDCERDFARLPFLIDEEEGTGEDYRDITESIQFSIYAAFRGTTEITVAKKEKGASVHIKEQISPEETKEKDQKITNAKWKKILDTLYCGLFIHEWEQVYNNPGILDGIKWTLNIQLTENRSLHISGSNAYPPYFDELKEVFSPFTEL